MKVNQAHFYLGWNNRAASWTFSIGSIIGRCCCVQRLHNNRNEIRTLWDFPAFHFATKKRKRSIWETQIIIHSREDEAHRFIRCWHWCRSNVKENSRFFCWTLAQTQRDHQTYHLSTNWRLKRSSVSVPWGTSVTSAANKCSVNKLRAVWSNIEFRVETSHCFYFCKRTFVSSLVL